MRTRRRRGRRRRRLDVTFRTEEDVRDDENDHDDDRGVGDARGFPQGASVFFCRTRFSVLPARAVLHTVDDAEDDASRGTSELRARRGGDGAEAVATSTLEGDE